jgi:AraC-like DNA-binding protein
MVDLIEKKYADRLTLKSVSTALNGKPEALGRLFQSVLGISVHDYVTRVRLDHAAHFIRSGLKIEAVALSVGYHSKKNFYRQFTRHFGITPETYRRRRGIQSNDRAVQNARRTGTAIVNTYTGTFADTECLIDVTPRPNIKGASGFAATPFVKVDHGIQPFAVTADHLEITGETEADAVERAALFLEHRFGTRTADPKRYSNGVLRVLTPRR